LAGDCGIGEGVRLILLADIFNSYSILDGLVRFTRKGLEFYPL